MINSRMLKQDLILGEKPHYNIVKVFSENTKLLEANADVIAEIISKEHGKPLWDAKSEVGAMVGKIDVTFESYNDRLNAIRSVHAI